MGYRYYFYKVENELLNNISNMSKEEFFNWGMSVDLVEEDLVEETAEKEFYLPLYKIGETFFELGSHYNNVEEIQKMGKSFFEDQKLIKKYKHNQPYIVGKEAVLRVIEFQKQLIIKLYEDMLFKSDEERLEDLDTRTKEQMYKGHLIDMYSEWKNEFNISAINLNENTPKITTSWKYEYSIFELVRLYKTTDWNKYGLLFMGW